MTAASKIEWPVCPYCKITINDTRFISWDDVRNPDGIFREKRCPKCDTLFYMATRVEVKFETEPV